MNLPNAFLIKDRWLFFIFLLSVISVLTLSYFSPDGKIFRDGSNYLRLARQLTDGDGFFSPVYDATGQSGTREVFFAIWPIGYPWLISLISMVTGVSVFVASKFLNIFCVIAIALIFRKNILYPHLCFAVLLFSTFIEITAGTQSELVFTTILLYYTFLISDIVYETRISWSQATMLFVSSISLFLIKYVGAFSFGIIGTLGVYFLLCTVERKKGLILLAVSVFCSLIMILYLLHNYMSTGFVTGVERIYAPEGLASLGKMFVNAIAVEVVPYRLYPNHRVSFIAITQIILFIVVFSFARKQSLVSELNRTCRIQVLFLLLVGMSYLISTLVLRSIFHFDNISFRFLAPSSLLLFTALILYTTHLPVGTIKKHLAYFYVASIVLSYMLTGPASAVREYYPGLNYAQTVDEIKDRYSAVPDGSTIVFGSIHMNYLYPSLFNRRPYKVPHSTSRETWQAFLKRLESDGIGTVYIDTHVVIVRPDRYDESVINAIKSMPERELVEIKLGGTR